MVTMRINGCERTKCVKLINSLFFLLSGKEELGILDNFDIGDGSSCNVETTLEGKLLRI